MNWKIILACFFLISIISCDNTLNLFDEPREIPIVYGMVSSSESKQYIRIERAFVDPEVPPAELAQNPSELFWDNVNASFLNTRTGNSYNLNRVNADDEGINREDGFFLKSPNYVYKMEIPKGAFLGGDILQFEMSYDENIEPVTSTIRLVDTVKIGDPTIGSKISILPEQDFKLSWYVNNAVNTPVIWDASIYINYEEANLSDPEPEWEAKTLKWEVAKNIQDGNDYFKDGDSFYNFLASKLEKNPDLTRQIIDLDIEIITGGSQLKRYIEVVNANTGITSSQPTPSYSNLSDGFGLIGERNVQLFDNFFVTDKVKDALIENEITKELNFK